QVWVNLLFGRIRAHPQDAVLAVQEQFHVVGHVVGHQCRQPDAEIDVVAVAQLGCGAGSDLIAGPAHGRTVLFSTRLSVACSSVNATTRCTNTPGVWMSSGCSSPGSTSSSTSAMVMRPHVAATGLKLRAARR